METWEQFCEFMILQGKQKGRRSTEQGIFRNQISIRDLYLKYLKNYNSIIQRQKNPNKPVK